jgi:hypothetical protein
MNRIAGWIEKTLEITLKSALKVDVENHIEGSNLTSRITIIWNYHHKILLTLATR